MNDDRRHLPTLIPDTPDGRLDAAADWLDWYGAWFGPWDKDRPHRDLADHLRGDAETARRRTTEETP